MNALQQLRRSLTERLRRAGTATPPLKMHIETPHGGHVCVFQIGVNESFDLAPAVRAWFNSDSSILEFAPSFPPARALLGEQSVTVVCVNFEGPLSGLDVPTTWAAHYGLSPTSARTVLTLVGVHWKKVLALMSRPGTVVLSTEAANDGDSQVMVACYASQSKRSADVVSVDVEHGKYCWYAFVVPHG